MSTIIGPEFNSYKLTKETNKWDGEVKPNKVSSKLTIPVANKFVEKDIDLKLTLEGIHLEEGQSFYVQYKDDITTRWIWRVDEDGNLYVEDANYYITE